MSMIRIITFNILINSHSNKISDIVLANAEAVADSREEVLHKDAASVFVGPCTYDVEIDGKIETREGSMLFCQRLQGSHCLAGCFH